MSIRDVVQRRQAMCEDMAPDMEYVSRTGKDPYTYRNRFAYERENPFVPKRDCKKSKSPTKLTDVHGKFYVAANTKWKCKQVDGVWDTSTPSRLDGMTPGVCWTSPEERDCSLYDNPDHIKHKYNPGKFPYKPLAGELLKASKSCDASPECYWHYTDEECLSSKTLQQRVAKKIASKAKKDFQRKDAAADKIQKAWARHRHIKMNTSRVPQDWPVDITSKQAGFQKYLTAFFHRKKQFYPPKHAELIAEGERCSNLATAPRVLTVPQVVINMTMKAMAAKNSPNRGLLGWWSTGAGKLTGSAAVIDAFWNTNKNIVYMSSIEALRSNPPEKFIEALQLYFPAFKDYTFDEIRDMVRKRGVRFMSFAQMAHYLLIANPVKTKGKKDERDHRMFLNDAVLIVDEVQNLFHPLPNQKKEHNALRKFLLHDTKHTNHLNVVIFTATPGDSPGEVADLLNLVRDRAHPPIVPPDTRDPASVDAFRDSIRGLVSFFNSNGDLSRFPKVIHEDRTDAPMSTKHLQKYKQVWKDGAKSKTAANFEQLASTNNTHKYMASQRRYSNMLFNREKGESLRDIGAKLVSLADRIAAYPAHKHWVYSAFYENRGWGGHGVRGIAKALEERGYKQITTKEIIAWNKSGKLPPPGKRYVLTITTEMTKDSDLYEITTLFNRPENATGEYVQVMLASQKFNEGVDLKAVRHIHMFEPLLTEAAEKQAIGRAARFCSHGQLPVEEWDVRVHRYFSTIQGEPDKTVDLEDQATELSKEIAKLEIYIQETNASVREKMDRIKSLTKSKPKPPSPKSLQGMKKGEQKRVMAQHARDVKAIEKEKKMIQDDIDKNTKPEGAVFKKQLQALVKKRAGINAKIARLARDAGEEGASAVEAIDDRIFAESKERAHDMNILFNVMRQSAIDCDVFQRYHRIGGVHVVCECDFYPRD